MSDNQNKNQYNDIINLSHHTSEKRPRMSISNRAAQFSAFAALSGHDVAISETARITDRRTDLDESMKEILNAKLQIINDNITDCPEITVTYFKPDDKKAGGAYITLKSKIKKIDEYNRCIIAIDGVKIPIDSLYGLESELFHPYDDINL